MAVVYSIYEAKAKFGEIIRKVRSGQRAIISYRGEKVAEIRPLSGSGRALETSIRQMELEGTLSPPGPREGKLGRLRKRPGALTRFLRSRD